MLEINVIMNSSIEDVLSFKCCNLHDQNCEIHLKNTGLDPIRVPSSCELIGDDSTLRIDTLYPGGTYTIQPGDVTACYCTLGEEVFARAAFPWIRKPNRCVYSPVQPLIRRGVPPASGNTSAREKSRAG